ncbi:hypothetical protein [Pseudomonas citronellolis]|uniref:hypothetical protein n=1 Tax=Pseudomonas citronellolis TaxID=53408 RepID=UPI0023E39C4A|nr:hypothetical protein [Pseudomonas citronellolis]MDF3933978.1 hypothetical protein [Pseudomonas citronellolis]
MDFLLELLTEVVCYKVGFFVLKCVTLGRFQGKSSYWDGLVSLVGGVVLLSPLIGWIAWLIVTDA